MKNTNFKTKLIARIILLVLLLASAVSFAGCSQFHKYVYFAADNVSGGPDPKLIKSARVSTDTKEFYDTDLNVDLYIGMHELNLFGQVKSNPKEQLPHIYQNDTFRLSVLLCKESEKGKYESVELKRIEDEELFSKEYGYISTPFFINNGITYMHIEEITIPKDYFYKDYGRVLIKLELSGYIEEHDEFYPCITYTITIKYSNNGEKIVLSGYTIKH